MTQAITWRRRSVRTDVGKTVSYIRPAAPMPVDGMQSLSQLAADMKAGKVIMLVILGCNPVYDAPADLAFRDLLADPQSKVKFRVHCGLYADETAEYCHWHIPAAHYLNLGRSPGLGRTVTPLIAPLYGGKTDGGGCGHVGMADRPAGDQGTMKAGLGDDFNGLGIAPHDGLIPGTASPPHTPRVRPELAREPNRIQAGKLPLTVRKGRASWLPRGGWASCPP